MTRYLVYSSVQYVLYKVFLKVHCSTPNSLDKMCVCVVCVCIVEMKLCVTFIYKMLFSINDLLY